MSTSIVVKNLHFAWPDGGSVFDDFTMTIGPGRTGLVGVNGSGKSTLLRLVAGELTPAAGSVTVTGEIGYLRQNLILDTERRVDDVLGLVEVRAAVAAIERGEVDEWNFAVVGNRWDVEDRTRAVLGRLGLAHIGLDRRVGELSGGELVQLGLAAQLLAEPDVLLLDEPTNNLDTRARELVYEAVRTWHGVLVIVSHDRELLALVDRIGELRGGEISFYGGNLDDYEAAVAAEQETARRMVRVAEEDLRRQKRELGEARIKLDRRERYGKKMWENKREPKVRMRKRIEDAEIAAGKLRNMHVDKMAEARDRLKEAEEAVRDDDEIRIELPDTVVPPGREVLQLSGVELRNGPRLNMEVRGPERIALVGANGSGKSTLLQTIMGAIPPVTGSVTVHVPARWLPQRLDIVDDHLSAVENVAAAAPSATNNAIRARLARFLLRQDHADLAVGNLSGGERFRATLATLLLAEPAPQLLLLDEPTNNLDLASVRQLTQALESYAGALIVASHDQAFLDTIGTTRRVALWTAEPRRWQSWYTKPMCADPVDRPPSTSRSDRVAEALRDAILSGRLRPDEVLVERRLADMLGVSKTPVREALIMLSSTGLVTLTRNRGMTVRRLTLAEVQQVYEERVLLEPWAVAQAIAHGSIDFAAVAATMDRAVEHADAGDATALTVTNRQFHRTLYSACENTFVVNALDQLQDLTVLAIGLAWENWPNRQAETVEHQEILHAARAGDAPKAEALVRLHIDRSLSRIRARNAVAR